MKQRQFTATVYIIDGERVLLIRHKKLGKWLPPGGHIDPGETPPEAAKREALEETGLAVELVTQENVWVDRWNAKSFERPYMCLLEEIPEHGDKPAHQHMDMIYVARPTGKEIVENRAETDGIGWFTLEEIERMESDVDIFEETVSVIRSILSTEVENTLFGPKMPYLI